MMKIAVIPVIFFLGNFMMFLFKTDKGFAEIQKMIECHIVETEESDIIFEARDNKFSRDFTWRRDEKGEFLIPDNLNRFMKGKKLKIERVFEN
jgi:hypothetical protein